MSLDGSPCLPDSGMAAMSLLLRTAGAWGVRRPVVCSGVWGRLPLLRRAVTRPGVIAPVRHSSNEKRMFVIKATKFYDKRFLNLLKFYIMLTGIPIVVIVTFINIFIGEAELAEIPEGYTPEHWEYHSHPITRWMAYYLLNPPEKDYEKGMALIHAESLKMDSRKAEDDVRRLMKQRGDGPWYHIDTPSTSLIDYEPKATPDN